MIISQYIKERIHPGMDVTRIRLSEQADINGNAAGRAVQSMLNKYPLISKKGDVREFTLKLATTILKTVEKVDEHKRTSDFDSNQLTKSSGLARFWIEGWRELTPGEFAEWLETHASRLGTLQGGSAITQAEFEEQVKQRTESALKAKEDEIAELRRQLAEKKQGGVKELKQQGELLNQGGNA